MESGELVQMRCSIGSLCVIYAGGTETDGESIGVPFGSPCIIHAGGTGVAPSPTADNRAKQMNWEVRGELSETPSSGKSDAKRGSLWLHFTVLSGKISLCCNVRGLTGM